MSLEAIQRALVELPRAQLSRLDVLGYGTALIESGSSYLERVRTDHDVSPRQMRFFMSQQLAAYADDVEPCGTVPDSPSDSAHVFVNRLAELTGQPRAARLGLSSLAPYVATYGTLRQLSAWCPICIKMAALGERKNYLPLLWSIGCVQACPVHNVQLQTRCLHCKTQISTSWTYELRFPFHHCPKCGASLYQGEKGIARTTPRANPVQLHVANLVGDLILQLHTNLWDRDLSAPDFREVLDYESSGFCGFVRKSTLSKGTASRLLAGERCSLEVYVRVALAAGVSLTSLFVPGKLEERQCDDVTSWSRRDVVKRRSADDWSKVIRLVKAEVRRATPCSFNQFCLRHNIDFTLFRNKIAGLADALNTAHRTAAARNAAKQARSISDRLIAEAKAMQKAGIAITRRALAKRLGEKRNNKVFISAWALATASSRKERLGSKALALARQVGRRQ